jgi:hypothetical protein
MNISYEIINKISPPNGFVQEQQKKLLIDLKTKRKLFGTIVNIGDIFLNIYAEVLIVSRSSLEQKNNIKNKKNLLQNTPQCYIKYNFQLNQSDYSPKSSKNKSSLINSNSEKHTLNSSKQDKCFTNKHSNYNLINYKINKENRDEENNNINSKKTYTNNFNNNLKKGFKNYSSRIQQKKYSNNNVLKEQNRKTIMDLLQQKKMMEKKFENNESEKFENFERGDQNMPIIEKKNVINKKEGYLAEQNFNSQNGLKLENKYQIVKKIVDFNKKCQDYSMKGTITYILSYISQNPLIKNTLESYDYSYFFNTDICYPNDIREIFLDIKPNYINTKLNAEVDKINKLIKLTGTSEEIYNNISSLINNISFKQALADLDEMNKNHSNNFFDLNLFIKVYIVLSKYKFKQSARRTILNYLDKAINSNDFAKDANIIFKKVGNDVLTGHQLE